MFEALQLIDADRKNSLPVADFSKRYLKTKTPVVFGDMSQRWLAHEKWDVGFFEEVLGETEVPLYSNKISQNLGDSRRSIMTMPANEYFKLLSHDEDDLQIREFPIFKVAPNLKEDFNYPRLGLTFRRGSTRLQVGGQGAIENMHYRADLAESFICNFGGRQAILLVKPEQAKYTYEPPLGFESIPTVDYSPSGIKKNPAITNLNAYYAELGHGDVLYIPSGYRYAVHYLTPTIGLTMTAEPSTFSARIGGAFNRFIVEPIDNLGFKFMGERWYRRKLRKAVRRSKS